MAQMLPGMSPPPSMSSRPMIPTFIRSSLI
jgi:hypothetical protein